MKKLKILMLVLATLIIICVFLLIVVMKKINTNNPNESNIGITENINEKKIIDVIDNDEFYTISNCVELFYKYIGIQDYSSANEMGEITFAGEKNVKNENKKKEIVYNLLDESYIEKNNINANNVLSYVDNIDSSINMFEPIEIKKNSKEVSSSYYVYGRILNSENAKIEKFVDIYVYVDNEKKSFSIYPISSSKNEINTLNTDIKIKNKNKNIQQNENNNLIQVSKTDISLVSQYFYKYKFYLKNKADYAFEILDKDYKEERFNNNIQEFYKYVDNSKSELNVSSIKEYGINEETSFKEYVAKDNYGNMYIFRETKPMNYTVFLDTYTVKDEKTQDEYNKYSEQKKVAYNVNKWIEMINNKDYKHAYYVLNETFRSSNFSTLDEFEKYIQTNFPKHCKIEYVSIQNVGNIYSQSINLSNSIVQQNKSVKVEIIMQLRDNMDFEMSFNVE